MFTLLKDIFEFRGYKRALKNRFTTYHVSVIRNFVWQSKYNRPLAGVLTDVFQTNC